MAILAGLLAYIVHALRQQPANWNLVWQQLKQTNWLGGWALTLLLLTPLNWALEALKWQILIRRIEAISLAEASQGVLAGLTLGFALPAQLGDTTGRVLSLRSGRRTEGIGASLVSGGMQFFVALLFGTLAWGYQLRYIPVRNTPTGWLLLGLLLTTLALGFVLARMRRRIRLGSTRPKWQQSMSRYLQVASHYTATELLLAFLVATLRYITFSIQFYLALRLFGIVLPVASMLSGIGLVFLAKTITPAFNLLSDLGVREAASLWVFSPFGVSPSLLLAATLTLWLVNILLPVLVGLIWVWKLKWTLKTESAG